MADGSISVELVTPEGVAFRGEVKGLRLPGSDGSFGILPRHAPLISALDVGILFLDHPDGRREEWAIGEGFAEVSREGTQVLCDFANDSGSIDVARAEQARERARERLRAREREIDKVRAEASLRRSLARLKVARKI